MATYNLAGMDLANEKLTGAMSLVSNHIKLLHGLRDYQKECSNVIDEGKRLLQLKRAEIESRKKDLEKEIFQIQQILGPDTAPKRSHMETFMGKDEQEKKRQKISEEDAEQNLLFGLSS